MKGIVLTITQRNRYKAVHIIRKKDPYPYPGVRINDEKTLTFYPCCKRIPVEYLCRSGAGRPVPYRMLRPGQTGWRFRSHLQIDSGQHAGDEGHRETDARDYMPGGVGAVAYNAIVAQRPAEAGTVVTFSGGSLLNLSQGKFGRYGVDDVRCWRPSVPTTG